MNRARGHLAALALLALSCHRDKNAFVVVHNDVDCDVPRVFQLRLTISNDGSKDQKTLPEVVGAELGFPSSLVLELPGARSGAVDLVVEALDDHHQLIGQGTASGQLQASGRLDLNVQLAASAYVAACGNGILDPGEECDDGNRFSGDGCSIVCKLERAGVDGGATADGGLPAGLDGSPTTNPTVLPTLTAGLGAQSTCAVRADTSLWCWGNNTYGQLRMPGTGSRLTPALVSGATWAQVSSGQTHACGVRNDGTLSCWGNNGSGQLGVATATASNQQVEVPGGPWQSVATGSYQTCAIKTDGSLWCWGSNANGQLGTGDTVDAPAPTQVAGAGFAQVSTNYLHTCAVKLDGTLWCWGLNADDELADATVAFRMVPGQVTGVDWSQVSTGLYHTCAVKLDGSLWCWGGNGSGQLGNAGVAAIAGAKSADPLPVDGAWSRVAAGQAHTCGVTLGQDILCWGDNGQGQLGDGTTLPRTAPGAVAPAAEGWGSVSAGLAHTCGITVAGALWCWGANLDGQLGVGSNQPRKSPAPVAQ